MLGRSRPLLHRAVVLLAVAGLPLLAATATAPRILKAIQADPAAQVPTAVQPLVGTWVMDEPQITERLGRAPRLVIGPTFRVTMHIRNRISFQAGVGSLQVGLLRPDAPLIATTDLAIEGFAGELETRAKSLFAEGARFDLSGDELGLLGAAAPEWRFVRAGSPAVAKAVDLTVDGRWTLVEPEDQGQRNHERWLMIGPRGRLGGHFCNHFVVYVDPSALERGRFEAERSKLPGRQSRSTFMIPDEIEATLWKALDGGRILVAADGTLVIAASDGARLRFRRGQADG